MNWKNYLIDKFNDEVIDVKLSKNDMSTMDLVVTSKYQDIEKVNLLTQKINNVLDELDSSKFNFDNLVVESKGFEIDLEWKNLIDGEKIVVVLNKSIKGNEKFIGELVSHSEELLNVRWNCKGQFRNQEISRSDIKKIERYIKY
ncbi:ribosome assembly cofactor RimP [Mycoplasma sp. Mirounga ES2805-ORL]|uniref:ribosome assembly cofactor RimP n=1 Tax=Mycoplasma sp. Mirounga ES2805-ORL TaxID=754514 RepID=UPI00197BA567|nr:ribosome assembly cofactor RimP [Mycoplasma sp. Mirounga ES2805-ORL]QSF13564.1 ribosome assembly cofactor RimP [Mycoplasma sp. Mirounga ES2805-ORL]